MRTCRPMQRIARLSIAPMMDWTDRHYRYMMRLITVHTLLYTEMLVDQTLLHQQKQLEYFLGHDDIEEPLAIQLGGNSVKDLGAAAQICYAYGGFCEINLNTGCPSPLVSSRCFGARLMLEPERVRDICKQMIQNISESRLSHHPATSCDDDNEISNIIPVTVKCRIGVDDHDSYEKLHSFISTVAEAGVKHFIIHARKCLLNGLSPHENRTIPPLQYDVVYQLKEDFPNLFFTLNGGVNSIQEAHKLLESTNIDGVMIGRAAYNNPWNFRDADRLIFKAESNPNYSRREIIAKYLDYAEDLQRKWGATKSKTNGKSFAMPTSALMKPLLALFNGEYGGKAFKRHISKQWTAKSEQPELRAMIESAMSVLTDEVLDARIEDEL